MQTLSGVLKEKKRRKSKEPLDVEEPETAETSESTKAKPRVKFAEEPADNKDAESATKSDKAKVCFILIFPSDRMDSLLKAQFLGRGGNRNWWPRKAEKEAGAETQKHVSL